jgi:hypothetical protein
MYSRRYLRLDGLVLASWVSTIYQYYAEMSSGFAIHRVEERAVAYLAVILNVAVFQAE